MAISLYPIIINIYNLNLNNKFIAIYYIKNNDINKKIRIINSFEQFKREHSSSINNQDKKLLENELSFKKNIQITINNKKIDFTYFYIFNKEGKYTIEYSFLDNLSRTHFMFADCEYLTNIDLLKFNNVKNMSYMFYGCSSLIELNFSKKQTLNIEDMSYMFYGCQSLKELNLSNMHIENIDNMSYMFYGCQSLKFLDLPYLVKDDNNKIVNMNYMFYDCNSLKELKIIFIFKITDKKKVFIEKTRT